MFQLNIEGQIFPCVVFDVDGVLVDTFPLQYRSFENVVKNNPWLAELFNKKFRTDFNFDAFNKQCNGRARPQQIKNLFDLTDNPLTQTEIDTISKAKDAEYKKFKDAGKIETFDGMDKLVSTLTKGMPLGFFSASTRSAEVVKGAELLDNFTAGIFPDKSGRLDGNGDRIHAYVKPIETPGKVFTFEKGFSTKPDDAGYIKCAAELGCVGEFLVIEDAPGVATTEHPSFSVCYVGDLKKLEGAKHQPLLAFATHAELVKELIKCIEPCEYVTGKKASMFEAASSTPENTNNGATMPTPKSAAK